MELLPGLPTAEELGRQHCGRILMIRDGVICDLEAVLCIREAFSLYIPAEGWEQEGGEAIWHAAASPRVRFGVLVCPGDEDAAVGAAAQLLGGGITFGVPQANGVAEGGGAVSPGYVPWPVRTAHWHFGASVRRRLRQNTSRC